MSARPFDYFESELNSRPVKVWIEGERESYPSPALRYIEDAIFSDNGEVVPYEKHSLLYKRYDELREERKTNKALDRAELILRNGN